MKTHPLLLLLLWTCSSLIACGQPDRRDRDDEDDQLVIIDADAGMNPDDELPPASMDPRCAMETCSGQGVCQIIDNAPSCLCNPGFQARGLACDSLPVGAPQVKSLSLSSLRLTQGESQTLELMASFEGSATATLIYIDPEDSSFVDELWDFEQLGEDTFVLELSWEKVDELFEGIYFDEAYTEVLTVRLQDEQGRILDTPMPLTLHCDGAGGSACDGVCVNFATDRDHCGACHTPTPDDATCQSGKRICEDASLVACDEACVPSNERNCGRCGNTCWDGASCDVNGGFCRLEERYAEDVRFGHASMVTTGGYTEMIFYDAALGQLRSINRIEGQSWSEAIAPSPPASHVLWEDASGLARHLIQDTGLIQTPESLEDTFAYMLKDPGTDPVRGTGKVYVFDFSLESFDWGAPVELEGGAPAYAHQYLESTLRLLVDRQGTQRLVYRSTQGFEVFSRSGVGEAWQRDTPLSYDFKRVDDDESTSFGYNFDVLTSTHHIVFADMDRYYHASRKVRESAWRLVELDFSFVNVYRTNVSRLFQGPDGLLHVTYRVEDQVVYRTFDPLSQTWSDAYAVTPRRPEGELRYAAVPEGFEVDEMGNRWLLTHAGSTPAGSLKQLFSAPYGSTFWGNVFVSGGLEFYTAIGCEVATHVEWDGGVSVHMLSYDFFNQPHVDNSWQYVVHNY